MALSEGSLEERVRYRAVIRFDQCHCAKTKVSLGAAGTPACKQSARSNRARHRCVLLRIDIDRSLECRSCLGRDGHAIGRHERWIELLRDASQHEAIRQQQSEQQASIALVCCELDCSCVRELHHDPITTDAASVSRDSILC